VSRPEVLVEEVPGLPGMKIVRLDAADRKNALTGDSARGMREALARVDADETVAVVIITGGPAFCAGAHRDLLDGVAAGESWAMRDIADVYGIFTDMRAMQVPTIAAVRGPAVGAGLNIALAADVRVVAENAYLRSMFVANQIHPGGGHLRMLSDIGGPEVAYLMGVLDQRLTGAEFVAAGLASTSVDDGEVESTAIDLARAVAAEPVLGRLIKKSLQETATGEVEDASRLEGQRQQGTLRARSTAHS
jgi:enoyl-CoA hydratase